MKYNNGILQLKLWNDHADSISEKDEGSKLTVKNVEVDIFQNQPQLKTIEISSILVSITSLTSIFESVRPPFSQCAAVAMLISHHGEKIGGTRIFGNVL